MAAGDKSLNFRDTAKSINFFSVLSIVFLFSHDDAFTARVGATNQPLGCYFYTMKAAGEVPNTDLVAFFFKFF